MKQKTRIVIFTCLATPAISFAASNHYFIGLQIAAEYNQMHGATEMPAIVSGSAPQEYDTHEGDKYTAEFGLRTGFTTVLNPSWSLQWGIGYYADLPQKLDGDYYIRNTNPPDLTYQFKLSTHRLSFEPRVYYHSSSHWSYFAGTSLGAALLHTKLPAFTPIIYSSGTATPLSANSNNKINFAYGVSVGVDYCIKQHWHIALGASQLWLGKVFISVHDGTSDIDVKIGKSKPTQLWLSSRYQF